MTASRLRCGVEGGWRAMEGAGFCGKAGGGPGAEASVEDVDVVAPKVRSVHHARGAENTPSCS